jgi:N-acetylneuraminate synthase
MSGEFAIGRRRIGGSNPTYFVADIAANHDGDLERAQRLIRLCAQAGADAAKFQNFRAETIVSDYGFKALGGQKSHQATWAKSVFQVYAEAALPMAWTQTLKETCAQAGIDYFTAPYDLALIEALSSSVCAWKLGSGDITWHASIERMARDDKPLLIATGASTLEEVRAAMAAARGHCQHIVLMQCNTNYTNSPDNFRHINLNVLNTYAAEFPGVVLGLSDHTPGHATVLGAVALGARVIEKHFTDDTRRAGPDHRFSMDPASWRQMVDRTRELEAALGDGIKRVEENEHDTVVLQRRAIRAKRPIGRGEQIGAADLIVLRPCPRDALAPYRLSEVVGRKAGRAIEAGDCVRLADLE